jgi:hypothetical protein
MPAATGPALDLVATRARFPALARPQIFADNAGGSQVLDTVIESCVCSVPWCCGWMDGGREWLMG